MMGLLKEQGDPRALGRGDVFDTYKYVGARSKSYETWLKAPEAEFAERKAEPESLGKKSERPRKKSRARSR